MMQDNKPPENFHQDVVQPFQLDGPDLRGRMVRLGPELNNILDNHSYPEAVSRVMAETVTVALLLAAMLKYEGIFTLQTKGDGPISMVVADVSHTGAVRAYASYDPARLKKTLKEQTSLKPDELTGKLLGKGYIAFTVDQGTHTSRYQGIVEMSGDTLKDSVQHYFSQSEQIMTGIKMAVVRKNAGWQAGAVMLQYMPDEGAERGEIRGNVDQDDWRRVMILLDTVTDKELFSESLGCNDVLFRLFHEEGVRVFDPQRVYHECRCSREKIVQVLSTIPPVEIRDSKIEDKIYITCEFCSKSYIFDETEIKEITGES